jgi:hypothetical protein
MRAAAFGLGAGLAIFLGYGTYLVAAALSVRSGRRALAAARWTAHHRGEPGRTVVTVSLLLPGGQVAEEHIVERIDDTAPDWSTRFVDAKQRAEERAFHLNADRDAP